MFQLTHLDHVGLRVTDLAEAEAFWRRLGFVPDRAEDARSDFALGLVNPAGLRVHLIYNGQTSASGNVLMDVPQKWPGYTHAAFVVDDLDRLLAWLEVEGIALTEGPTVSGSGRRRACFIRDPDRNVIEFNEIL